MARNNPVRICAIRHSPNSEPKFHQAEIFEGVGRSITMSLVIFIRGWDLRRLAIRFL